MKAINAQKERPHAAKIRDCRASLAGGVAASTLREEGFDGEIVLIGAEQYPPYERPPVVEGISAALDAPDQGRFELDPGKLRDEDIDLRSLARSS